VGTNGLSLAEVKVWQTPTNLALNKIATQSSTYAGSLPEINPTAYLAVDGNTSGNRQNGFLAHTIQKASPVILL